MDDTIATWGLIGRDVWERIKAIYKEDSYPSEMSLSNSNRQPEDVA